RGLGVRYGAGQDQNHGSNEGYAATIPIQGGHPTAIVACRRDITGDNRRFHHLRIAGEMAILRLGLSWSELHGKRKLSVQTRAWTHSPLEDNRDTSVPLRF